MRRPAAGLLLCSVMACGGDSTPLPPLHVGAQWKPLMLDTTGNMVMRRMALWIDTSRVTVTASGTREVPQQMQMDMKIGGMSTNMQMRVEIDCAGKRYRMVGLDSMSASMKGKPMPDSVAKQVAAQQSSKLSDTTWRAVTGSDGTNGTMLTTVCAAPVATQGAVPPAPAGAPAPAPAAAAVPAAKP
jgi:hypothetical protein